MKILAIEHEKPGVTADDFKHYLRAEALRAWELTQANIIRELYFRADRHDAVLVLECASVEEARAAINTLPLVAAGLIDFEIIPLVPYTGFVRLFAE